MRLCAAAWEIIVNEGVVVFARRGLFQTPINASEIKSREHYRKLWPIVTADEPRKLVTWVKPVFDDTGKLLQRSYFRRYPSDSKVNLIDDYAKKEAIRRTQCSESIEHKLAKRLIADELQRRLDSKLALPWSYRDDTISQYHLEGNLLLGVDSVTQEQEIKTPFGSTYRLDVALLGKPILRHPMILGGVEIERDHAFDGLKALAGRSMGFPLISVDITGMSLTELTQEWAKQALTATTTSSTEGLRKTYIYLNDLLYPLYVKLPTALIQGDAFRHQYIVFAEDRHLEAIKKVLVDVASVLGLSSPKVLLNIVNGKSESAAKQVSNMGDIVGSGWRQFNERKCLTVTLDRPQTAWDIPSHLMHIAIASLLATKGNALVGYKDRLGIVNDHPEEDVWREYRKGEWHRTLPNVLQRLFSTTSKFLTS